MLNKIVDEKWLTASGVACFCPCRREGDDVIVTTNTTSGGEVRLPFLRQQISKRADKPNMCLADFIPPQGDWIGGFAVTAGQGLEPQLARVKPGKGDYSDILPKAQADRLDGGFGEGKAGAGREKAVGNGPQEDLVNQEE